MERRRGESRLAGKTLLSRAQRSGLELRVNRKEAADWPTHATVLFDSHKLATESAARLRAAFNEPNNNPVKVLNAP